MSRIKDLISMHCSSGVGFKSLSEICQINRGRVMSKDYLRDHPGPYPVYSSQTANEGVFGFIDSFDYDFESITWTTDGANAGSVFYHCDKKFSITNVCGLLKVIDDTKVSAKYLYYALGQITKRHVSAGMGNPKLMSTAMSRIRVPLPPLEVQREIVAVLDRFTKLEAELEAELEARRKQYQYYRDAMLSFDERMSGASKQASKQAILRWATLESICMKTNNIKWRETPDKDYAYIDLSSVDRSNNEITETRTITAKNSPSRAQQIVLEDDVIFGTTRPTLKRFCYVPKEYDGQICSTGFCVLRADKMQVLPKYLYFSITTAAFNDYVKRNQKGAGYPAISDAEVKSFKIPIPLMEEQERIVAILDKFDALVNDLSSGLPAEIKARRLQYEYYRDRLLSFKEAA